MARDLIGEYTELGFADQRDGGGRSHTIDRCQSVEGAGDNDHVRQLGIAVDNEGRPIQRARQCDDERGIVSAAAEPHLEGHAVEYDGGPVEPHRREMRMLFVQEPLNSDARGLRPIYDLLHRRRGTDVIAPGRQRAADGYMSFGTAIRMKLPHGSFCL